MGTPYWLRAHPKGITIDLNYDRPTGVRCPRPQCDNIVVYNGNYFCECGWALLDVHGDLEGQTRHPGLGEFLAELNAAGWWDAYFDEGAEDRRRAALERLNFYDKKTIERSVR